MKLTEAEKAQIEQQRAAERQKAEKVSNARKTLLTVSDDMAVQIVEQVENCRKYIAAKDKCGCLERTDELCWSCKKAFDRWFFGRKI